MFSIVPDHRTRLERGLFRVVQAMLYAALVFGTAHIVLAGCAQLVAEALGRSVDFTMPPVVRGFYVALAWSAWGSFVLERGRWWGWPLPLIVGSLGIVAWVCL